MDNERIKKIILEMYTGQVNMQDAVDLITEYMKEKKGSVIDFKKGLENGSC
jgi:hypothetical protein